ncbi:hypothetical protein BRADI_1g16787v3 [Brachypodium distachyon]|uniref:Myb/SANT-like domain-containing protein n=1 Tax=Brachypodium distachyon TaxID=15368 RepID=A0A0Q3GUE3_BRADI|nr:hypothetical protein BRADI_1g16787v3 [Brachypodium distachyon]
MPSNLANLVATGVGTSSGFKRVHLNNCAKVLNEHFKTGITHAQVSNHLKKWRKVWINVTKLRNLSGALWDGDTFTILLDPEHYANHIKDHKSDVNYLNTPIEHYNAMATIFGASMTTGKFAKSGNDPLNSVEVHDIEDEDTPDESATEVNMSPNQGDTSQTNQGESSHTKLARKKAKLDPKEEDPLLSTLKFGLERVATVLEKSGKDPKAIPEGLWDDLASLLKGDNFPRFINESHLARYYSYLVDKPRTA